MNSTTLSNTADTSEQSANRVAIVGASGYGGLQTIRLLKDHPIFRITHLVGNTSAGKHWNDVIPFLPLENNPLINKFDINEIDTSMGGIGGSPFIETSSGNIATEDTIYMLENMGYDIGIDIKKISSLSRMLEKDIGESYFSGKVYKTI